MEWIIANWETIVALAIIAIGAVIAVKRVVNPDSVWLPILVYILGIIEDLAPDIAAKIKGEVKAGAHKLPPKQQIALKDAVTVVDPKKPVSESIKKAV